MYLSKQKKKKDNPSPKWTRKPHPTPQKKTTEIQSDRVKKGITTLKLTQPGLYVSGTM